MGKKFHPSGTPGQGAASPAPAPTPNPELGTPPGVTALPSTDDILNTLAQEAGAPPSAAPPAVTPPAANPPGQVPPAPVQPPATPEGSPSAEPAITVDGTTYNPDRIRELELGGLRQAQHTQGQQQLANDRRDMNTQFGAARAYLNEIGAHPRLSAAINSTVQQYRQNPSGFQGGVPGNGNEPEIVDPEVLALRTEVRGQLDSIQGAVGQLQGGMNAQMADKAQREKNADIAQVEAEIQAIIVESKLPDQTVRERFQAYIGANPYLAQMPMRDVWDLMESRRQVSTAHAEGVAAGQQLEVSRQEATALGSTTAPTVSPASNIDFKKENYDSIEDLALTAWEKGEIT